ncbi:MAG: hypothetical protein WDW36_005641 [Sanguina aurantia]
MSALARKPIQHQQQQHSAVAHRDLVPMVSGVDSTTALASQSLDADLDVTGSSSSSSSSGSPSPPPSPALMLTLLPTRTTSLPVTPSPRAVPLSLVVFSGGTAFNSVAGALRQLTSHVTHVLPVSDDGGSTAEIVRVIGGPAVGDIRSRCLRLADDSDAEARAVKTLLAHRLAEFDATAAKQEWYNIVEGEHRLWGGVSEAYKHMIRAFLVHFHTHILSHSTERFNFTNGSVGNFFFAGARVFFRSLEAAIFLFSRVARLPEGSHVLPAISTDQRITLGAELEDGSIIRGQNEISHPSIAGALCIGTLERVADQRATDDKAGTGAHALHTAAGQQHGIGHRHRGGNGGERVHHHPGDDHRLATDCVGNAGAHEGPMTAADMVQAVCDALNRRRNRKGQRLRFRPPAYVTGLLVPRGGAIPVDMAALNLLGVRHVLEVDSQVTSDGAVVFEPRALVLQIEAIIQLHSSGGRLEGSAVRQETGSTGKGESAGGGKELAPA